MHVPVYVFEEMFAIRSVRGRRIIDSRGSPTVQAVVVTEGGGVGVANAPSGASTGRHEAVELRDGGERFGGRDVSRAVRNINEVIAPALRGMDSRDQWGVDEKMIRLDGSPNKSRLGGNAVVATSLAVAKAAAATYDLPLYRYIGGFHASTMPVPLMNIINGGVHAGNKLDFQEFMIVPGGFDSFSEALRAACEVYYSLKRILKERYGGLAINVGDEGGFAPPLETAREALMVLSDAVSAAGYSVGGDIAFALDVASSQLYDGEKDRYLVEGKMLTREELLEYYRELVDEFPIVSIEDPFHEEDYEGFRIIREELGSRILVVGDDLFTTNPERLRRGIEAGAANAVLVKVNQVGTLSETFQVVDMAHRSGYRAIISHRSGETEDTSIADLAVGLETGLIKTGAPARGERTAKYNRLLVIEEEISRPYYPGFSVFPRRPK